MGSDTQKPPVQQLSAIHEEAIAYFERATTEMPPPTEFSFVYGANPHWTHLSQSLKDTSSALAARLALLAQLTGPAIQRSPLLTEVDQREAGYAFKGMRSALRFRQYRHYDPELLNDEDIVLGVRPSREEEEPVTPALARQAFDNWSEALKGRLELIDPQAGDQNAVSAVQTSRATPIAAGFRPDTAFIMMWMSPTNPELIDVSNVIKETFRQFGVNAVRADDIEHEDIITQRILDEIKTAEFLIADLSGERPSVYYEVGYAQALGRRVILYRKAETPIHFDLAAYNCPEYKNLTELKSLLIKRLESVTGRRPKTTE